MDFLRGLIAVGVRNPVLANLLMLFMLVGGYISAQGMVREIFPERSINYLTIEVAYPGAGPEDAERRICTPIEEALRGLEGIEEVLSEAADGGATIWMKLGSRVKDPQAVLKDVKDRVDQLTTLPLEARKPVIRQLVVRLEVVSVAIYGDVSERTLKSAAQQVKDDLLGLPGISQVALSGVRDNEIVIEVSRDALQAYRLSLGEVIGVVAKSSLDLPAGLIRTAEEELTLRVTGQRYSAAEYEDLVVLDKTNAAVRLGDIATVREGFEDAVVRGRFNGQPAALVVVYKTPQEDSLRIASAVREYVAGRQSLLPESLHLAVWADSSVEVQSRISMLLSNGLQGLVVLFATIWLFLEFRLAFWVAAGIPISFAGAMVLMNYYDQSINVVSLFALIMVSGIIVDDSIVIAESVHTRREAGEPPQLAAIEGTLRVALPVLGSTLITTIAFMPLLFVAGVMGHLVYVLPIVVIASVGASAVEALLIEPAHLCYGQRPDGTCVHREPNRLRRSIDAIFTYAITRWYRPLYHGALHNRMVAISVVVALLLAAAGVWYGGRTPFVLLPKEDGNVLRACVRFPEGTPSSVTERMIDRLEAAARKLLDDPALKPATAGDLVRQIYSISGEFPDFYPVRGSNLCEVRIELMPSEQRRIDDDLIIERWRHYVGELSNAAQFTITRQQIGPMDRPIQIRLLGQNLEDLREATDLVAQKLQEFDGVNDIHDDLMPGKRQLRVKLRPAARALGLTLDDAARQLRDGFFGGEALRFQRGADEVKVRVRYPEGERQSVGDLENVRIVTPAGHEVPFLEVADVEWARSYARIFHQDGKRQVRVQAELDERLANAEQIVQALQAGPLDSIVGGYPGLSYRFGGARAHWEDAFVSLRKGFLVAILANYALLAVLLRSWAKPVVVMAAVPFGAVGVIGAHLLLGFDLTMMSIFGLVGVSGLVVNEALVLVDSINWLIREGKSVREAVFTVGELRFRPVLLTSITDLAGLMPLLLSTSGQAQSVRPMAISLSFGLLSAAVLTLLVVPVLYLAVNDLRRLARWLRYGGAYPAAESVEEAAEERILVAG